MAPVGKHCNIDDFMALCTKHAKVVFCITRHQFLILEHHAVTADVRVLFTMSKKSTMNDSRLNKSNIYTCNKCTISTQ